VNSIMRKRPALLAPQQTDKSRGVSVRQKKNYDEENVSDQEIWSTIRYLDPDTNAKASNLAVTAV